MKWSYDHCGISLIVVVAAMLVFAVLGVLVTSLVSGDSDVALNHLQSEQAFHLAEAGKEFGIRRVVAPVPPALATCPAEDMVTLSTGQRFYVCMETAGLPLGQTRIKARGEVTSPIVTTTQRSVEAVITNGASEAITNGTFPSGSIGSWPDVSCPPNKNEGTVTIDMANDAPPPDGTGSLRIQSFVGRKQTMRDCREQTLGVAIPPSTPVTLNLNYQFSVLSGTCATARCFISVIFVYSTGATETVWNNGTTYPPTWLLAPVSVPWTTLAGANMIAVRLSYDIESPNDNNGQATGWIDDVSLTYGAAPTVLSWKDVYN